MPEGQATSQNHRHNQPLITKSVESLRDDLASWNEALEKEATHRQAIQAVVGGLA